MEGFLNETQEVKKTLTKNSRFNVRYCFIHKLTVTKQNRQKLFSHIVNHICIQNQAKLNKKDNFVRRFSVWISIIVIVVILNFKFLFVLSSIFAFIQAVPCFFNFISLLKVFALLCFDFFCHRSKGYFKYFDQLSEIPKAVTQYPWQHRRTSESLSYRS